MKSTENNWANIAPTKLTRRNFLFALAGALTLKLPARADLSSSGAFEPFSFAFVSEVNLATRMNDTDLMLQESSLFLQDVVKTINGEKLDFTIFGGDQIETPGKDDANWQLFLDTVQSLEAPWTFVLGDRDVSGPRVVDKMKMYGQDWKAKGITTETSYWSQSPLPSVHLIGLDTSRPNLVAGDLSKEQLDWLKKDIAANKKPFTIVFSHHPLLAPPPFDGGPPWDDYIVPQGATAREILGSSNRVHLALSGHVHASKIQQERQIWYVSNPSLSSYPCCFRVFHVTPDEISVETFQVAYPALVKKARTIFAGSPLAFKYSESKPDSFNELLEGVRLDQNAALPLAANSSPQPLRVSRKKKKEEQAKVEEPKKQKEKKHKDKDHKDKESKESEKQSDAPQKGHKPEKQSKSEKKGAKSDRAKDKGKEQQDLSKQDQPDNTLDQGMSDAPAKQPDADLTPAPGEK